MSFPLALFFVFISGFISLSYEIFWFRVFFYAMACSAKTFGIFLFFFLLGIALGASGVQRFCRSADAQNQRKLLPILALVVVASNLIAYWVAPVLSHLSVSDPGQGMFVSFLLVTLSTAMFGAALPLLSHVFIAPDHRAGSRFSYLYLANILGAAFGSLITGFVLLEFLSVRQIALCLLGFGFFQAIVLMSLSRLNRRLCLFILLTLIAIYLLFCSLSIWGFDRIYARLLYKNTFEWSPPLVDVLENRHGIIVTNQAGWLYGNGIYDGTFSVNLVHDKNMIVRAFALGVLHPGAEKVLIIGSGSGSWAKVISNIPSVKKIIIIEINPGYLQLISKHAKFEDLLKDPKVEIIIDDGRRWLRRNPSQKFDAIVSNTTFNFAANATNLLSSEFLDLIERHLKRGGVFYYNTTGSLRAIKTGLLKFEYGIRVINCLAVSHSPLKFNKDRWEEFLKAMRINGQPVIQPEKPEHQEAWRRLLDLPDSLLAPQQPLGLETRDSLLARASSRPILTDDNMGTEFDKPGI